MFHESLPRIVTPNEAKREKATPSRKTMCDLWPPFHLAQEVGAGVGRGEVLQRALSDGNTLNFTPVTVHKSFSAVE
jgi:hypothetical protein